MRVAIAGASGLIGSAVARTLRRNGHEVIRMVRRLPSTPDEIHWDPEGGTVDTGGLQTADAVVNLAGAPIQRRWTSRRKRQIHRSRVHGTRLLAATLAAMADGPGVFVVGVGMNFYGYDRGDEVLTEKSSSGDGFLARVVRDWEAATDPAREAGVRVVTVRTGLVQARDGGLLQILVPLFRLGLGGRMASGRQWWSWITLDDLAGVFAHAATTPGVEGPLNGTAPNPVRNAEYAQVLADVLNRPALVPAPAFGPALLFGRDAARELALVNLHVVPEATEASGYRFRHPYLQLGLRAALGASRP